MMTKTMQAAVIDRYHQQYPRLKQMPIPTIAPHEVLVKIIAASINPLDLKIMAGGLKMLLPYQMPLILGNDMAGVVTAVGAAVSDFHVGDAVYSRVPKDRIGTFAEYIAVDQAAVAIKPNNVSFEEAAALPLVALTSYQVLHDVMHLQPGQKVFIPSGAGGVGTIAIQIAKHLGAYVATTTSAAHFDLVQALGADEVIDYHTTDFSEKLHDLDAVFDTRGGQDLKAAFQIVKPGGKVVSIDGLPNARFGREYGVPLWKQWAFAAVTHDMAKLERKTGVQYVFWFMKPSGAQLKTIAQWVEAGVILPVIDRVVPFDEIEAALAYSRAGHATGKIVLKLR